MDWIINSLAAKFTEIKTGYAPGATVTGLDELTYVTRTYIESQQLVMELIPVVVVMIIAAIVAVWCFKSLFEK